MSDKGRPVTVLAHADDTDEPPVDYGCGCPRCKARYTNRVAFQRRAFTDVLTKHPSMSADDAWRVAVAMANSVDRARIPFELVETTELVIVDKDTDPDLILGAPPGVTLQ